MLGKLTLSGLLAAVAAFAQTRPVWDGTYAAAQAQRGQTLYREDCARCHGQDLSGGEDSPALAGAGFLGHWRGKTVLDLLERTSRTMPTDNPGGLGARPYADTVAYILSVNRFRAGAGELGAGAARAPVPGAAAGRTQEWRYWGGDAGSTKYSRLNQIDASNVRDLHIAWSWKAQNYGKGPDFNWEVTPLDGRRASVLHRGHAARCGGGGRGHRGDAVDVPHRRRARVATTVRGRTIAASHAGRRRATSACC